VFAFEGWGETLTTAHPWHGAELVFVLKLGAWVWNLAGFVWLCLVFPDGLLPGRRWRGVVGWSVAAGLLVNATQAFFTTAAEARPTGRFALRMPDPAGRGYRAAGFRRGARRAHGGGRQSGAALTGAAPSSFASSCVG